GAIAGPDANGVFTVKGDHTYANLGSFPITVTIVHETNLVTVVRSNAAVASSGNGFDYDPGTRRLGIGGRNIGFSQTTTADANGEHTQYTFVVDGVVQTVADTALAGVVVNGQGPASTAILSTGDTFVGRDGALHETPEIIVLGPGGG